MAPSRIYYGYSSRSQGSRARAGPSEIGFNSTGRGEAKRFTGQADRHGLGSLCWKHFAKEIRLSQRAQSKS